MGYKKRFKNSIKKKINYAPNYPMEFFSEEIINKPNFNE